MQLFAWLKWTQACRPPVKGGRRGRRTTGEAKEDDGRRAATSPGGEKLGRKHCRHHRCPKAAVPTVSCLWGCLSHICRRPEAALAATAVPQGTRAHVEVAASHKFPRGTHTHMEAHASHKFN